MPRKKQSRGNCAFCGREMSRGGLSKHLQSCPKRQEAIAAAQSGAELTHIYDFGTSSETLIKAVATRMGKPLTKHPVYLMARNKLPDAVCDECDAAASLYCVDCLVEQGEWITLCDKHRTEHDHDEYGGPSPLVNSPRLGMCGYDGPTEPPY